MHLPLGTLQGALQLLVKATAALRPAVTAAVPGSAGFVASQQLPSETAALASLNAACQPECAAALH